MVNKDEYKIAHLTHITNKICKHRRGMWVKRVVANVSVLSVVLKQIKSSTDSITLYDKQDDIRRHARSVLYRYYLPLSSSVLSNDGQI